MFDAIVSRVKSFLGAEESRETLVREPRIIPKSEHGIDPELVSWQAKRCCEALQRAGLSCVHCGRRRARSAPRRDAEGL